jgi:hypothetical protein
LLLCSDNWPQAADKNECMALPEAPKRKELALLKDIL